MATHAYAYLGEKATEMWVCWLDDDGPETKIIDVAGESISVDPLVDDGIPISQSTDDPIEWTDDGAEFSDDWHLYRTLLSGLDLASSLDVIINNEIYHLQIPDPDNFKFSVVSDTHNIESSSPSEYNAVFNEAQDLLVHGGDVINWAQPFEDGITQSGTESWINWIRDFLTELGGDQDLVPWVATPGNHGVGEPEFSSQDGLKPDGSYFSFFCPNTEMSGPDNNLLWELDDRFALLMIDSMSSKVATVTDWLDSVVPSIDTDWILPVTHQPHLIEGDRNDYDFPKSEQMIYQWVDNWTRPEVRFTINGHTHIEKRSRWMTVTDDDSNAADSEPVRDDKFLVATDRSRNAFFEVGSGWKGNRSLLNRWYTEDASSEVNWQLVEVSNPTMTLHEMDSNGNSYNTSTFGSDISSLLSVSGGSLSIKSESQINIS